MNKQMSFKNELKTSLILHSLTHCIFLLIVIFICISLGGLILISQSNKKDADKCAKFVESSVSGYKENALELSKILQPDIFETDKNYRADILSAVYAFLNKNSIRGNFYLFDESASLIYSTQIKHNINESVLKQLRGKLIRIAQNGERLIYVYDSHDLSRLPLSAYLIFSPIYEDDTLKGICGYFIELSEFDKYFMSMNSKILLINAYDRIMNAGREFADERGKLKENFKKEGNIKNHADKWYYIRRNYIKDINIMLYVARDCTTYIQVNTGMFIAVLLSSFIMMLAVSGMADKIAKRQTAILDKLISALKEVENGNLEVHLDIKSDNEFRFIGSSFNMMLGSIRHLLERHGQMARENVQAAVQIMESQFHPHFLFNTLESIKYLINTEPETAKKMIVDLSKLLRYSIKNGADLVCLYKELDFTKRYAEIMKFRFKERFEYIIEADEELTDTEVPAMILQPIVENALQYGFSEEKENLCIQIKACRKGEVLCIEVSDDGAGIEEEFLGLIIKNLTEKTNKTGHIGLYNVHKRIELLYGNEYGIKIESMKNIGTKIILCLPL